MGQRSRTARLHVVYHLRGNGHLHVQYGFDAAVIQLFKAIVWERRHRLGADQSCLYALPAQERHGGAGYASADAVGREDYLGVVQEYSSTCTSFFQLSYSAALFLQVCS
jgi:hypothetical protein